MPANDLPAFIARLRTDLERGLLPSCALSLGNEMILIDVEKAVRALLAEVDFFAGMPIEQRVRYPWQGQRQKLADSLRRLQERLPLHAE